MSLRKWRRLVWRRWNRKPQVIPHKIHYAGIDLRVMLRRDPKSIAEPPTWGLLYQATCKQMRLSAIYSGAVALEGNWISLLNSSDLGIYFAYPIDIQIRPRLGVTTPHTEEDNGWN